WESGGLPFLGAFSDLITSREANDTAADFVRAKIREIVRDREVADLLTPRTVLGCKRLCSDTHYYETFNRPNVTLIDVTSRPIEALTPGGLTAGGVEYEVDAIVFATGFDAMTGALLAVDIRGRDGLALRQKWSEGPRTYLGLATAGFPNLFFITGPGSPSVLSNMVPSIELHVNEIADATLYPTCNSWYIGANIPGKPRVFMPYLGFPEYVEKADAIAANGYEGFELSAQK